MPFTKIRLINPCHNKLNDAWLKYLTYCLAPLIKLKSEKHFNWKQLLMGKHEFACIKIDAKNIKHGSFKNYIKNAESV